MTADDREELPDFPEKVSAQHGHLATIVSRLRRSHESGASWEALSRQIDVVIADVRRHFVAEEAVMEAAKFDGFHGHRNEHDVFLRRLEITRIECELRQTELMPLLLEMLETWFKRHEATWDREASEAIAAM